jgi:hypothetical protein
LRANIEYVSAVDAPPVGREPLDWMLFDYKKGFCNYYASAQVILLRVLGIPARLAVGYAQGERHASEEIPSYIPESRGLGGVPDTYVVRSKDAHAWPEVYFPGYGWVEFEPTASRAEIRRPLGDTSASPGDAMQPDLLIMPPTPQPFNPDPMREKEEEVQTIEPSGFSRFLNRWGLPIVIGLLLLALVVWHGPLLVQLVLSMRRLGIKPPSTLERWAKEASESAPFIVRLEQGLRRLGLRSPGFLQQWALLLSISPLTRAYLEINRALRRLGRSPAVEDTPAERVAVLVSELPEASIPAHKLLAEYQAITYSPHRANALVARQCTGEIRRLSILAWLQRLLMGASRKAEASSAHRA